MRCLSLAYLIIPLMGAVIASASHAQELSSGKTVLGLATTDLSVEVVADDLNYPWDIKRAGDRILITEAGGTMVTIEHGRLNRHAVETSDPIVNEGGSGLLGMALAEDFQTSGLAYLYHTYRSRSGLANKVIQARFDGRSWRETRVLLEGIPGHRLYNGGRIAIGPDGCLYVTTGWTENGLLPQDLGSLAGKILRMTRDGKEPSDNPFKEFVCLLLWPPQSAGPRLERCRRTVDLRTWTDRS